MAGGALGRGALGRGALGRESSQPGLFGDLPEMQPPAKPGSEARLAARPIAPEARGATAHAAQSLPSPGSDPADADDPVDLWSERLYDAFEQRGRQSGLLNLAEDAIKACPGAPVVYLLAATAALLDKEPAPARALVFLKRFSKRATAPAQHLLQALALHEQGKTVAAWAVLRRHDLTDLWEAMPHFLGGVTCFAWLSERLGAIMASDAPASGHRAASGKAVRSKAGARSAVGRGKRTAARSKSAAGRKASPSPRDRASRHGGAATTAASAPTTAPAPPPALKRIDIDIPLSLEINTQVLAPLLSRHPEGDGRWYWLRARLAHLALTQGFDELVCLDHCHGFEPLWHQIETVRKVLKSFRGRVLLADEVGLGKTIEASMVAKEYALRGMAERMLVLTPASLVGQWREELATKFDLAFASSYDPLLRQDPQAFWAQSRIVASIATARRREHAAALQAQSFDLVICDEAHHLRDRKSQSWRLVDGLNKRFLLLLSATPVQNDLIELYNLLTLLKPGIFKTQKEFRAAYMTPGKPRQPANPERLRTLIRDAMIRNTRAVVALKLPRRHALTIEADPAPGEAEAYGETMAAARAMLAKGEGKGESGAGGGKAASKATGRQRLALHHLLAAAGSSPAAAAAAAARMAVRKTGARTDARKDARKDASIWHELAKRWSAIGTGGKEAALLDLLRKNETEKKLVFVHSRATLAHLGKRLEAAGLAFARFDGSMSGPQKDAAIEAFRDTAPILLTTQSGGEGRNIQFCNTLINFDLPLNPMAIEQRIGRIDRIGQTREVFIFNLVTAGTLEEQVLTLLGEKIAMFELVVGEVGAILGGLEESHDFGDLVLEAWLQASDKDRLAAFRELGQQLDDARRRHEGAKALDEKLFSDDFEAG